MAPNSGWITQLFGSLEIAPVTELAVLKITGTNIVPSGDNAVVIALDCRNLPPKQWTMGILLGAGAAVILPIIFTVLITDVRVGRRASLSHGKF